ncbi:MAG: phage tail sheath subtilisin-like domain-containing protein [Nitrospirota bacterium]|nr:phage tail sheath subtilisin-like domain-containing protein [Nitrospirota bacterium]
MSKIFRTPGVYIQELGTSTPPIPGTSTSTAVVIGTSPKGPQYRPTNILSLQAFVNTYDGLRTGHLSSLAAKQYFDNGGKNLWVISTGTSPSKTASPLVKGLARLSKIPSWNILFIPETTLLPIREAAQVFESALPLIQQHRAMFLLDLPQPDPLRPTVNHLIAWIRAQTAIQHPNMILYYPRVQVRSPIASSGTIAIPASGTMAGVFARIDSTRGIWKAPAGTDATLQGVVGLEPPLTSQEINRLTSANMNALIQLPSSAYIAWGARTLSSDPEWKYVPVRRTALFLESSVEQGTAWAVFEPNNEPLWARIRQSVQNFMEGLFRQGAFQGTKSQDAYFVKCGRETTTAADQAAGLIHIMIGFAPLKPAEFVILKITHKARPAS